jgi:hypothetical protein
MAVVALLSFVAAAVFFGLAVFEVAVRDVNLIAAGLFCCAIGFVIDHAGAARVSP